MTRTLHEALEETVGFIDRALARIEVLEDADAEAHNLRAYLIHVLELIERDPGIDAAVDDLDEAARALAAAGKAELPLSPSQRRMPREAFLRFRDRLLSARPSEGARRMGLT